MTTLLSQFLRGPSPVSLPPWLPEIVDRGTVCPDHESRIRLAIELSQLNVCHGTGGPFGTTIFNLNTGELIGVGVNRVVPTCDPTAHGEVVALRVAAALAQNFTLSEKGSHIALYTSSEPCGMCATAVLWGGISALFYAATREDVEGIGFDEGLKPIHWKDQMLERGIVVEGPLLQAEAVAVLQEYQAAGSAIYNGTGSPRTA